MSDLFKDSNVDFNLRRNSSYSTNDNAQFKRNEVNCRDLTSAKKVVRSRSAKRKKELKRGMLLSLLIAAIGLGALGYVFKDDIQGYIEQYRIQSSVVSSQDDDVISDNIQFIEENSNAEETEVCAEEDTTEAVVEDTTPVEEYSLKLLNEGYEFREVDWTSLKSINEDIVGYIEILGTSVSFPMVQSADDNDYLHTDIYGNYLYAGTPFADKYSKFSENLYDLCDHTVIHGHHMIGNGVFATVDNYQYPTFLAEHPYVVIYTEDGQAYLVEVFSVNVVSGESLRDFYPGDFADEEAFNDYVNQLNETAIASNPMDVQYGDKILSLVTCTYKYGNNKRLVVTGKVSKQLVNSDLLIQSGEEYTISR